MIVYHSLSGNTEATARAVAGTQVVLKLALDASLEDLLSCDAVAFGSAEYFSQAALMEQ